MTIKQTKVFQIGRFVQELQKQVVICMVVSRFHIKQERGYNEWKQRGVVCDDQMTPFKRLPDVGVWHAARMGEKKNTCRRYRSLENFHGLCLE